MTFFYWRKREIIIDNRAVTYHRERSQMLNKTLKSFDLQIFAEEGDAAGAAATGDNGAAATTAENPVGDGAATGTTGEQTATATGDDQTAAGESWESLIKGKYKEEYSKAVKTAVSKRFKHQQDLEGQISRIDPIVRAVAQRYHIQANPDGSIPIDALSNAIANDDSIYEEEAMSRGISVNDLKHEKALERENSALRSQVQQSQKNAEWNNIVEQSNQLKQIYPDFDLEAEMGDENFGHLLVTLQNSGIRNAVQTAYEVTHRNEIMGGAMKYAVQRTAAKVSNAVQSGIKRPVENGTGGQAATSNVGATDINHLTLAQINDYIARARRGEKITFK